MKLPSTWDHPLGSLCKDPNPARKKKSPNPVIYPLWSITSAESLWKKKPIEKSFHRLFPLTYSSHFRHVDVVAVVVVIILAVVVVVLEEFSSPSLRAEKQPFPALRGSVYPLWCASKTFLVERRVKKKKNHLTITWVYPVPSSASVEPYHRQRTASIGRGSQMWWCSVEKACSVIYNHSRKSPHIVLIHVYLSFNYFSWNLPLTVQDSSILEWIGLDAKIVTVWDCSKTTLTLSDFNTNFAELKVV